MRALMALKPLATLLADVKDQKLALGPPETVNVRFECDAPSLSRAIAVFGRVFEAAAVCLTSADAAG